MPATSPRAVARKRKAANERRQNERLPALLKRPAVAAAVAAATQTARAKAVLECGRLQDPRGCEKLSKHFVWLGLVGLAGRVAGQTEPNPTKPKRV